MTRRQRGFTRFTRPVFPSLWPPGGRGALGPLPRASHPTVTHDARRGGDGPCALDRALNPRQQQHLSNLLQSAPLPRAASCRTTRFSQQAWVGVKCTWTRGLPVSHALTAGCLWAA
jgi:hypothetical protein